MDFYAETAVATVDRSAQLQLQAWHIASSPSLRCQFMPRLSSIPEASDEKRVAHQQCANIGRVTDDKASWRHDAHTHQPATGLQHDAHNDTTYFLFSSSDSDAHTSSSASEDGADDDATLKVQNITVEDLPAVAASTWATHIRHFTDCLPITPDSIGSSSSTFLSATSANQPHQQRTSSSGFAEAQQCSSSQKVQHQHLHDSQQHPQPPSGMAVYNSCSPPVSNSSSSDSFLAGEDGTVASATGQAAVQASLLAALQDLDDLEWCPWDRVTRWLEAHHTEAAEQASHQRDSTAGADPAGKLRSSYAAQLPQQTQAAVMVAPPGAQTPGVLQGSEDEAVFDAPAWWQEAVLARLQEQRDAFHGSWWSRARVLASLAAARAACALQI